MLKNLFNNLFKNPEARKMEREVNRNIVIQKARRMHEQHVKRLERYESNYKEMALKAKKSGDHVNFRHLCTQIAQTVNQRRAVNSQMLYFETMLQKTEKAKLDIEFAKGVKKMMETFVEVTGNLDVTDIINDVQKIEMQSHQMESKMGFVLDQIGTNLSFTDAPEGGLSAADIERMLNEETTVENADFDKQIEASLTAMRNTLQQQAKE